MGAIIIIRVYERWSADIAGVVALPRWEFGDEQARERAKTRFVLCLWRIGKILAIRTACRGWHDQSQDPENCIWQNDFSIFARIENRWDISRILFLPYTYTRWNTRSLSLGHYYLTWKRSDIDIIIHATRNLADRLARARRYISVLPSRDDHGEYTRFSTNKNNITICRVQSWMPLEIRHSLWHRLKVTQAIRYTVSYSVLEIRPRRWSRTTRVSAWWSRPRTMSVSCSNVTRDRRRDLEFLCQ